MIFHENRLLADDSHEISYLIFIRKLGKMSQNLWSYSDSFTILGLWVLRLAVSNINESQLQTYESKHYF